MSDGEHTALIVFLCIFVLVILVLLTLLFLWWCDFGPFHHMTDDGKNKPTEKDDDSEAGDKKGKDEGAKDDKKPKDGPEE